MTLGFPLDFTEQADSGLSTIVRTLRQVERLPQEVERDPGQKRFQLTLHCRQLPKQEDGFWKKLIGSSLTPDQARLLAWLEQTGEVEASLARLATGVSASETRKLLAGLVVKGLVEAVGEEGERLRLAPHFGELLARARAPASSGDLPGEGTEQVTTQVTAQVSEQVVQVVRASQGEQSRAALMEAVGLSHREHYRESYLVPALAAGYLEMTIPGKPTSSR